MLTEGVFYAVTSITGHFWYTVFKVWSLAKLAKDANIVFHGGGGKTDAYTSWDLVKVAKNKKFNSFEWFIFQHSVLVATVDILHSTTP